MKTRTLIPLTLALLLSACTGEDSGPSESASSKPSITIQSQDTTAKPLGQIRIQVSDPSTTTSPDTSEIEFVFENGQSSKLPSLKEGNTGSYVVSAPLPPNLLETSAIPVKYHLIRNGIKSNDISLTLQPITLINPQRGATTTLLSTLTDKLSSSLSSSSKHATALALPNPTAVSSLDLLTDDEIKKLDYFSQAILDALFGDSTIQAKHMPGEKHISQLSIKSSGIGNCLGSIIAKFSPSDQSSLNGSEVDSCMQQESRAIIERVQEKMSKWATTVNAINILAPSRYFSSLVATMKVGDQVTRLSLPLIDVMTQGQTDDPGISRKYLQDMSIAIGTGVVDGAYSDYAKEYPVKVLDSITKQGLPDAAKNLGLAITNVAYDVIDPRSKAELRLRDAVDAMMDRYDRTKSVLSENTEKIETLINNPGQNSGTNPGTSDQSLPTELISICAAVISVTNNDASMCASYDSIKNIFKSVDAATISAGFEGGVNYVQRCAGMDMFPGVSRLSDLLNVPPGSFPRMQTGFIEYNKICDSVDFGGNSNSSQTKEINCAPGYATEGASNTLLCIHNSILTHITATNGACPAGSHTGSSFGASGNSCYLYPRDYVKGGICIADYHLVTWQNRQTCRLDALSIEQDAVYTLDRATGERVTVSH